MNFCVWIKSLSKHGTKRRNHKERHIICPTKVQNFFTVKNNISKRTEFEIYATKSLEV